MDTDSWSLAIQILGLVVAFLLGFRVRLKSLTATAVGIGIISAIIGRVLIGGGGPGAFASLFVLPICCIITIHLGYGIRSAWQWISRRRSISE